MARRRKKQVSAWEAMNHPVIHVTDEAARMIFLVAALILLMIWLMPNFGIRKLGVGRSGMPEKAVAMEYQPLLAPYQEVAGAATLPGEAGTFSPAVTPVVPAPQWYFDAAVTGNSFGDFYHETVVAPFSEAATEILDVSPPVRQMADFLAPGVHAVSDAWLELMADPAN